MSIRLKLLVIILGFFSFAVVTFAVYSSLTAAHYRQLRTEEVIKTVAFESEKINKLIAKMERIAVDLALVGAIYTGSQSDTEQLILELTRNFIDSTGIGLWYEPYAYDKDHERAGFYARYDSVSGGVFLDNTLDYAYHELGWYRDSIGKVKEPCRSVWLQPYYGDTSGRLMTTIAVGIYDKEKTLIGVTHVDWMIEDAIHELSLIKPTEGSFVLLGDPNEGYIILNTYGNAGTVGLFDNFFADSHDFVINGISYMPFGRLLDNGWFLSVQIPANEIFAEIEKRNKIYSLVITFFSIVTLCLLGILISKLINKPIKKLTDEVLRLAVGNLDTRIEVKTKDELGVLARTFNEMTVRLKESIEAYVRERTEKERIGAELDVATRIQASMLPRIFPAFPNRSEFDIYALMDPAKEVGGDFYDFFFIDENKLAVVIADVSGKGVPAALFMVIAKTLIKNNAQHGKSASEVFETVNNLLCENNDTGMFVTAFMGILDIPSGRYTYVNAGHNLPLIKIMGSDFRKIVSRPSLPLAIMEDTEYLQDEITLRSGDMLYLYTDGVTEAVNRENKLFTEEKLLSVINGRSSPPEHNDLKDLLDSIRQEIDAFASGAEQADDITMLAIKLL